MTIPKRHLVLVAGEASGDLHAAHLVDELRHANPNLTFSGMGGSIMQNSGVQLYEDLTKKAVIGFWEVVKHYPEIKKSFNLILDKINESQAEAVILVDYPGFNLRLAKKLKDENVKVIYYISPQVWAWKENRVHLIKQYVDQMLVLFQFEKVFYDKYHMPVTFVGHPLLDEIHLHQSKEQFLTNSPLDHQEFTIGLMPGSREKEIERHLPLLMISAKKIHRKYPNIQFLVIQAPTISTSFLKRYTRSSLVPLHTVHHSSDAINACDMCFVCSGTATLETAILEKPMLVIYKTSFLTWLIAKLFVKIKNIALANIVYGERIVPELVQNKATADNIMKEFERYYSNQGLFTETKEKLRSIKEILGGHGASRRAAQEIMSFLNNKDS